MSERPWPIRLALAGMAVGALGCGLGDLFRPSGPEGVALTYEGPTDIPEGAVVPFRIVVRAGDALLPNPRLLLSVDDTTSLALRGGGDSLAGKVRGTRATLTAQFHNSLLGDSLPRLDTVIWVRPP